MTGRDPAEDDLNDAAREALAFEAATARGILARVDGEILSIDGDVWVADAVDGQPGSGVQLILVHPSGLRRLVEVQVYAVGQQRPLSPGAPS